MSAATLPAKGKSASRESRDQSGLTSPAGLRPVAPVIFWGALAVGLASLAIGPLIAAHEYGNALLLLPLALAAGVCFAGILTSVIFFDGSHD